MKRVCGVHLNKRIDHAMWCVPGLLPRHINYAVLDVYALFNMYTKYMQAPLKDSTSLFVSELSISSEDEDEFKMVTRKYQTTRSTQSWVQLALLVQECN